jgi:phosphonate transport system substrate-binding protein
MKKYLLSIGLSILMIAGVARAEMPNPLNVGIISTESSTVLKKNWDTFLDDMAKYLKVEVKPFFAADYAGIIEGMRFGKVHVAWYGNKAAIVAVDRSGGEIFAQTVGADGSEGYYSLLIAHKDSPINSLEDLMKCDKTLTFGNGDPNSTSGFLIPSFYVWAKNKQTPKNCFKRVLTSNHSGNAMAVANNKVDIATNNTENIYKRLAKTHPKAFSNIKEIWRSPLIPSDPMVWRKDLSAETKEKLAYFFLQYGRFGDLDKVTRERISLAKMSDGWGPFLASSNAQLIPIRQLALFKNKLKITNDSKLSQADKDSKIAKIDAQLAEVAKFKAAVGDGGN